MPYTLSSRTVPSVAPVDIVIAFAAAQHGDDDDARRRGRETTRAQVFERHELSRVALAEV